MPKKPKMSKLAKDTLKEMAREPIAYVQGHVCPPHEHEKDECRGCGVAWSEGYRLGFTETKEVERIVYRTPKWIVLVVGISLVGIGWLNYSHPRVVHDTVEVDSQVTTALVNKLNEENGELRDQHSQDVARMAAVHDLLDMGKFHAAYKMSKPKETP